MSRSNDRGRSLRDRLVRVLDVRPGERGLLITAVAFALLAVAAAILSRAVGDALFLTAYPLSAVPRFFIVSNAVFIAGSMLYSALVRVVRPVTLNVSAVALFATTMIAGRALIPEVGATPGLYALCVWLTVAPPLLNILCWNAIADGFDSRQARRLVPIIFAGCTVGAILAGIAMGPYIAWFGLENLLYALGVTIALCLPLPIVLARASSRSDAPGRSTFVREATDSLWEILKEGVTTVSRSRLLRSLAAIVLLAAVVTNLVDFAFKGMLQANFGRDEIGTFYGQFNAIANSANLLLQLFVVSRVIERFGIARMFRVLPVTLLAGTLMLGVLPMFATIVGLKLVDYVLRFAFQSSANEVVIAPIPYVDRNRAKIFIKGAMNPLGAVLAGALLIPLTGDAVPATVLFGMLAVVLGVWLWVVRGIGRAHAEQLYVSLREKQQSRTPVPGEAELFGAGGRHRRDLASLVTSSVEWSTLSGELERHERHDDSPSTPHRAISEDAPRVQTPSGRWMIDDVQPARRPGTTVPPAHPDEESFPRAGLTDDAPVVRRHTLERLAGDVRRGESTGVPNALLEGLLWREIQLAYAMQCQRQSLGDVGSGPARRAAALLGERLDDTVYRIFLTLGLLGELELVRTAYLGLQSDPGRTRAHALDLVEATIEGTPFHRAVMLLLDEMSLEARLERARRQLELRDEVFSDPVRVLMDEHDPQLNRLLLRFTPPG